MKDKIFTFWEPKDTIPSYLELCLQTWKKYLPDYEIVVLNYSNLFEWIDKDTFDEILYSDFSLPIQADAIRCAALKKYGGIWMDMDTIITSNNIHKLIDIDSDFITIGHHIAFLKAKKNSEILDNWYRNIAINLEKYAEFNKIYNKNFLNKFFKSKEKKQNERWDYIGNYSLGPLNRYNDKKICFQIDKLQEKLLPEINWAMENSYGNKFKKIYQIFYFENNYSDYALKNNGGIICLHNSWTPLQYKQFNEKEFLIQDNTIANIFKKIL